MSTPSASMRSPSASASPTRRLKRKASEAGDVAGPSSGVARSRTTSRSPFPSDYAPSSTTPSPVKRQSIASSSRRNSRQSRTFQIADDYDQDQDAPYDEDLDADGEFDEEFAEPDAEGEDDSDVRNLEDDSRGAGTSRASASAVTAARQSARPKRSNATAVAYYDLQPLPGASDEEQDEMITPSVRRRNKTNKLPPTSDVEVDADNPVEETPAATARSSIRGTRTNTPSASRPAAKATRPTSEVVSVEPSKNRSSAVPEEPELSEEAKQQAKAEKEAHDLQTRWTEEYFEIVEQLPLELHRTLALMRELEGQMQTRVATMVQNMTTYRDARLDMQKLLDSPQRPTTPPQEHHDRRKDARGSSEDEAENLLGGSQDEHVNGQTEASRDNETTQSLDFAGASKLLDKDARCEFLRAISSAANESVKAAEEKMNLAATAYDGIDRHIRRLDADISKLESSILLGLRAGTEESRGAREALGLPVDDDETAEAAGEDGQASQEARTEAETAALTKAAGAANRTATTSAETDTTASGKRLTRSGPKTAQPQPATSPRTSPRAQTRSRSRSASASAGGDKPSTSSLQKTASPAPTTARSTRKRKPHPLSPQKGGRRSIATNILSPTTQTLHKPATLIGPDTSDMPVDPAEPRYCYCDQVSFDEMVACDNEDCKIEWFHYACVGLTRQPKKEWYCRFCAPAGWKGEGMGVPDGAKHRPPGYKKGGMKP